MSLMSESISPSLAPRDRFLNSFNPHGKSMLILFLAGDIIGIIAIILLFTLLGFLSRRKRWRETKNDTIS